MFIKKFLLTIIMVTTFLCWISAQAETYVYKKDCTPNSYEYSSRSFEAIPAPESKTVLVNGELYYQFYTYKVMVVSDSNTTGGPEGFWNTTPPGYRTDLLGKRIVVASIDQMTAWGDNALEELGKIGFNPREIELIQFSFPLHQIFDLKVYVKEQR